MTKVAKHSWVEEFPASITVCDSTGIILEMNRKAAEEFDDEGGRRLIGTNVYDCHPEPARTKLKQLMKRKQANVYTTKKGRVRKLVCQMPWFKAGKFRGFVEITQRIQGEIPNIIRDIS